MLTRIGHRQFPNLLVSNGQLVTANDAFLAWVAGARRRAQEEAAMREAAAREENARLQSLRMIEAENVRQQARETVAREAAARETAAREEVARRDAAIAEEVRQRTRENARKSPGALGRFSCALTPY